MSQAKRSYTHAYKFRSILPTCAYLVFALFFMLKQNVLFYLHYVYALGSLRFAVPSLCTLAYSWDDKVHVWHWKRYQMLCIWYILPAYSSNQQTATYESEWINGGIMMAPAESPTFIPDVNTVLNSAKVSCLPCSVLLLAFLSWIKWGESDKEETK